MHIKWHWIPYFNDCVCLSLLCLYTELTHHPCLKKPAWDSRLLHCSVKFLSAPIVKYLDVHETACGEKTLACWHKDFQEVGRVNLKWVLNGQQEGKERGDVKGQWRRMKRHVKRSGYCECFSGSVLAGCCEEWERSNQQVYCRRNSSPWEACPDAASIP